MLGFASAVSTTLLRCVLLIALLGGLGTIVDGALVRVAIADFIGPKDFSAFTQDTAIS